MKTAPAVLLVAIVAAVMSIPAGAATTLVVDDDLAQCPNAGYSTIADAIADAEPGDTIVVCPGVYDAATVGERVTLRGFTPDISSPSKCEDVAADDPSADSIVDGFTIASSFVTISGFTLDGGGDGVLIPGGTRTVGVTGNVIEGNVNGINFNGVSVVADHNCIRGNATGVYSDQGLVSGVITANAFVANNGGDAITLIGDGAGSLTNVRVDRNTSSGDDDLISLIGTTETTISGNTVTGAVGSAIYVQDGNSGLVIEKNSLQSGADEGIAIDAGGGAVNQGLSVTSNKITSNSTVGIAVRATSLTASAFVKNTVVKNGADGLRIEDGNVGNTLEKNTMKSNGLAPYHDCFDATTGGTGTGSTDNTWTKDKGKTENTPGLCKGAKVT